MVTAQQLQVAPGQLTQVQPGQLAVAPGIAPAQFDIGTLLASITPLIMLMLVFMMIMPMFQGMSEAFKRA
jgi:hypothetical protein